MEKRNNPMEHDTYVVGSNRFEQPERKYQALTEMFLNEEIRIEIAKDLFVQWVDSNLNDNLKEAEHEFMKFASDDLKAKYNHFYGLSSGDDYYLEVTD